MADLIYENAEYLGHNPTWHEEDSPYKASMVGRLISESGLSFANIADVGCGSGRVAEIVAASHPASAVYGYDISPDVAHLWAQRSGVTFKRLDYSNADAYHDLVLCLDVFEHVEDYYAFLRRLCTRSGHVIFNIPLDLSVLKAFGPGIARARHVTGHLHYFNAHTAIETLKECEYQIVHSALATPLFANFPRNPFQWILASPRVLLSLISKRLCATLLGGYSLLVLARCPQQEREAAPYL